MKSKSLRLTAAAAIIVGVLIGIGQFGGSIDGTSIALADVLAHTHVFRPYSYTETIQREGNPNITRRMMHLSPTRRREVYSDGYTQIFDFSQSPCRMLALHPDKKLAAEKTYPDQQPKAINPDIFGQVRHFENEQDSLAVDDLGTQEVDGRTAQGFHVPGEHNDWIIWADVKTGVPIRIELTHPKLAQKLIMTEFEFDVDFDQSLFDLIPPEGYTVKKVVDPTEEDLIEGLRAAATFLGGEFPSEFQLDSLKEIIKDYIEQNHLSPSEEQIYSLNKELFLGIRYFARLVSGKDYFDLSYVGGGVRLGDADTPILWYSPQGTPNYHVIYGDLSVEEVVPEDVPR